jgi:hypothetical protein
MKIQKVQKFEPFSINILIESEKELDNLKEELYYALSATFKGSTTAIVLTKILEEL